MAASSNKVEALAAHLGVELPHLARARQETTTKLTELAGALAGYDSLDLSVVVFGSLARRELTADSDPDWTLLVDGAADPRHLETSREIRDRIHEKFARPPGKEGTFGSMSFSHDLVAPDWRAGRHEQQHYATHSPPTRV